MWVEQLQNGKYKYVERYTDYLTGKSKKVSITLAGNDRKSQKLAIQLLNKGKVSQGNLIEITARSMVKKDVANLRNNGATLDDILDFFKDINPSEYDYHANSGTID